MLIHIREMENLPETLYVDPTGVPSPTAEAESDAKERARIERYINLLHQPMRREEALALLNKVYVYVCVSFFFR